MDLVWPHGIELPDRTLTAILGPVAVPLSGINHCRELSRYPFLYVCSNFSQILTGIHRTVRYSVRRGFTQDQVLTIVDEAFETVIFIEHDPTLYQEDRRLVHVIAARLRQLADAQAIVVVYSPVSDVFMREVFLHAHRIHAYLPYDRIVPPPRPLEKRAPVPLSRQATLHAFSSRDGRFPGSHGLNPLPGAALDTVKRVDLGCRFLEVVENAVGILPYLPNEGPKAAPTDADEFFSPEEDT
jgi:hypothetical protein